MKKIIFVLTLVGSFNLSYASPDDGSQNIPMNNTATERPTQNPYVMPCKDVKLHVEKTFRNFDDINIDHRVSAVDEMYDFISSYNRRGCLVESGALFLRNNENPLNCSILGTHKDRTGLQGRENIPQGANTVE